MKTMRCFLLSTLLTFQVGCSTFSTEESSYEKMIESETQHASQYDGFYQTFQTSVTFLNTKIATAVTERKSQFSGYDAQQAQKERSQMLQNMSRETQFILRLYTPENQNNDLNKPDSIWKIYLESNGQRYVGKAVKMTERSTELKYLYPHADRFSQYYLVRFLTPTTSVESQSAKIILTSPLGTKEFLFSNL